MSPGGEIALAERMWGGVSGGVGTDTGAVITACGVGDTACAVRKGFWMGIELAVWMFCTDVLVWVVWRDIGSDGDSVGGMVTSQCPNGGVRLPWRMMCGP
jgi:hypothetical protein